VLHCLIHSPPQSVAGSLRGVVDQLQTDACDELPGIASWGGLRRFAGLVKSGDACGRCLLPVVASRLVDVRP